MKARRTPWWVWLFGALVLLGVLGVDVPIIPLIIVAVVLSKVLGGRTSTGASRPRPASLGGSAGGAGRPLPADPADRWAPPSPEPPMPTIDVPRYPGGGQAPGAPAPPPSAGSGMPPHPGRVPAPVPVPVPGAAPGPAQGFGARASHTATDPVVSLGQLHLARCGRDLRSAAEHGSAADVTRVLDEIGELSRRMQDMLGAAAGTPGSGRREFAAGLRAVDRLVDDARGERPPGPRLTRLTQACLRMGQTGRHE